MNNPYSNSEFVLIVPTDEKQREFLISVDRKTKGDVDKRFGIIVRNDWYCNTVTCVVFDVILSSLTLDVATGDSTTFNFFNLFSVRITNKVNTSAEKENCLNAVYRPGKLADEIIADTIPDNEKIIEKVDCREYFKVNEELQPTYSRIEELVRWELSRKYKIVIPNKSYNMAYAIAYVYIENIFKTLLYNLKDEESGLSTVNLNDIVEMHASLDKNTGEVTFAIRPGVASKLSVKNDDVEDDE